jgi:hypothetical protein
MLIIFCIAILYGCGASNGNNGSDRSLPKIDKISEEEYLKNASCSTTYQMLNEFGEVSIPIILRALDIYSGEINADKRRSIINGALYYERKTVKNEIFYLIIQRGLSDPSEIVRLHTEKLMKKQNQPNQSLKGSGQ